MSSGNTEKQRYMAEKEAYLRACYQAMAPSYSGCLDRYAYYYDRKIRLLRHLVPHPGSVLEVGCGLGQNLAGLNPDYGLGIDLCPEMVEEARKRFSAEKFSHLEFRTLSALECGSLGKTFDTILLVNSITEIPDLAQCLREIRKLCTPHTRVVQVCYNYLLAPLVKLGGRTGVAPQHPVQNWLSRHDIRNVFELSGFELVTDGFDMVMPFGIPYVSGGLNRYLPLIPLLRPMCMLYYSVARPINLAHHAGDYSVSVCVPCKNEAENIPGLVERIPEMGKHTEIIFVDDQSTDATATVLEQEKAAHPEKDIKIVKGPGINKGAACRAGFVEAQGDMLMILDADMSVMPEDLPQFAEFLAMGKGEFINGSRLVYPMEQRAMRLANMVGNKVFAMLFSFVLSQRLKDTLCGTKAIWRREYPKILAAREHFGAIDHWGDYDWIFGAARNHLKIVEVPVHYRERLHGETKMTKRLKNAGIMLQMVFAAFRKLKLV